VIYYSERLELWMTVNRGCSAKMRLLLLEGDFGRLESQTTRFDEILLRDYSAEERARVNPIPKCEFNRILRFSARTVPRFYLILSLCASSRRKPETGPIDTRGSSRGMERCN